jgi:hypothetical protein
MEVKAIVARGGTFDTKIVVYEMETINNETTFQADVTIDAMKFRYEFKGLYFEMTDIKNFQMLLKDFIEGKKEDVEMKDASGGREFLLSLERKKSSNRKKIRVQANYRLGSNVAMLDVSSDVESDALYQLHEHLMNLTQEFNLL